MLEMYGSKSLLEFGYYLIIVLYYIILQVASVVNSSIQPLHMISALVSSFHLKCLDWLCTQNVLHF